MTETDWRYRDSSIKLRQTSLSILLSKYGRELNSDGEPKYSNQSIYECAHDWVSQGNMNCDGIVKCYESYYAKSN